MSSIRERKNNRSLKKEDRERKYKQARKMENRKWLMKRKENC